VLGRLQFVSQCVALALNVLGVPAVGAAASTTKTAASETTASAAAVPAA
jgi:hypothetical protein